ncbi:hypothetical protein E1A91_D13G168100v1 [Gossypium mustelinum]|uniref:Uncharacterized protein n=1 Tax=Gossypium mustelinum TaxID=34275 RepID=A0A5D2S3B1_GOSMU|nr:hypothetical protein E1A91_D13G168100v1 [Gossypium mustelinum]
MKIQPEKLLMIDDVEYIGSRKSLHLKSLFPKISLSIKFFFEYLSSVFQFPPFSFPESCFLSSSGNLQFSQVIFSLSFISQTMVRVKDNHHEGGRNHDGHS